MGRRQITDEDRSEAKRLLVSWLASDGVDIDQLTLAAFEVHIEHHTFPGEDFMRLAIDALDIAGIERANPIAYESLLVDHLPEIEFRGKEYRKIRFTVMSAAALRGGLEPDLLDEISYWNDDYWRYALYATIALTRAAADKTNQPVTELARQLAEHHQLDLTAPESPS